MLLKDCPVGSVVRLDSLCGSGRFPIWWRGNLEVKSDKYENYVVDGDGAKRDGISDDPDFQFEIVHPAPEPTPEPRITFTVGGQEFYVGQRVWSTKEGESAEVLGSTNGVVALRNWGSHVVYNALGALLSTTPPAPHEWKRGDWARHEDGRIAFVCGAAKLHGEFGPTSLMVSFENEAITNIPASEFTFISHSEPPE